MYEYDSGGENVDEYMRNDGATRFCLFRASESKFRLTQVRF